MADDGRVEYYVTADTSSYDKDIEHLKKTAEKAGDSTASSVDKSADKAEKSVKESASAAEKATKQAADNTSANAEKGAQIITKAYKTAVTAIGAAASAIIATGVKFNSEVETYQTSFEVMLGSAEEAAALTEKLVDLGAQTPFAMTDLADATQLLINYGLSAEDAYDSMSMLGDIAQGSAEKLDSIALAYGQMSSLGKVQLQDIKQMINAGFNPLQEIAETTGESMESLYARISAGTLSVDEITAAMQRSTSAGGKYFQSMQKQSKTVAGQWSTLKDTFEQASGKIVEGISDWLADDALPAVNDAVEWLGENFNTLAPLVAAATVAVGAFVVAMNYQKIVDGVGGVITAFKTLNATMAANPILAVATAVVVLTSAIAGIVTALENSNEQWVSLNDDLDEMQENLESSREGVAAVGDEFDDSITSVEAAATLADRWITRLETLAEKSSLTAEEQREWDITLDQLSETIPGISDLIDDQTGEIIGGTSALRNYVAQWKQTASAKAYAKAASSYTDELADATKALIDAEYDRQQQVDKLSDDQVSAYNDIIEKAEELNLTWGDNILLLRNQCETMANSIGITDEQKQKYQELGDAINFAGEDVWNLLNTYEEYNGLHDELVANQEDVTNRAYDAAIAAEEHAVAVEDSTEAVEESTESLGDYADKLGMTTDEYEEALNRRVEVTQNAFEKIEESEALSLDQMIANLQSNQALVEEWTKNLGTLAERGLDEGLLRALEEAGPEAAGTVRNLVNASDDELAELNSVFESGSEEAIDTLLKTMNLPETTDAGTDAIDNAAEGASENDALVEAAKETVKDTKTAMLSAVAWNNFHEVGQRIIEGMIVGLNNKSSSLYSKVSSIVSTAVSRAKKAAGVASPSKKTMAIFEYVGEGMVVGLENKRKKVLDTAENITTAAIGALTPNISTITNAVSTSYSTSTTLNNMSAADSVTKLASSGSAPVYLYLDGQICGSTLAPYMSCSLEQLRVSESRGG